MNAQAWNTLFFYKNIVNKNIQASNSPKIKNILRTYKGFKSWEKKFADNDIEKTLRKHSDNIL